MRVAFAHTWTPTLTTLAPAMRHCTDFKVRIRGAGLEGLELLIFWRSRFLHGRPLFVEQKDLNYLTDQ